MISLASVAPATTWTACFLFCMYPKSHQGAQDEWRQYICQLIAQSFKAIDCRAQVRLRDKNNQLHALLRLRDELLRLARKLKIDSRFVVLQLARDGLPIKKPTYRMIAGHPLTSPSIARWSGHKMQGHPRVALFIVCGNLRRSFRSGAGGRIVGSAKARVASHGLFPAGRGPRNYGPVAFSATCSVRAATDANLAAAVRDRWCDRSLE